MYTYHDRNQINHIIVVVRERGANFCLWWRNGNRLNDGAVGAAVVAWAHHDLGAQEDRIEIGVVEQVRELLEADSKASKVANNLTCRNKINSNKNKNIISK